MLPHQVVLRSILELNPKAFEGALRDGLFILDDDESVTLTGHNEGMKTRYMLAGDSKKFDYTSPLWLDGLSAYRQGTVTVLPAKIATQHPRPGPLFSFAGNLLPSTLRLKLHFEKADARQVITSNTGEINTQYDFEIESPIISARFYRFAQSKVEHFYSTLACEPLQLDFPVHPMDYRYALRTHARTWLLTSKQHTRFQDYPIESQYIPVFRAAGVRY